VVARATRRDRMNRIGGRNGVGIVERVVRCF
jgi:hypothetical protein